MRHFGRQALIVAMAMILWIGQACACLSHADIRAESETGPQITAHAHDLQSHDAHAAHSDHGEAHQDHAGQQPCEGDCPHCADRFATALQSEAGAFTLSVPAAKALAATALVELFPDPFSIPRQYLALNWQGPPGDTPVSLNSVMRV